MRRFGGISGVRRAGTTAVVASALLVCLASAGRAGPAGYVLHDLGTPGRPPAGPPATSEAAGVNERGDVAGTTHLHFVFSDNAFIERRGTSSTADLGSS